ncbi:hypothetical protein J3Q64DRAFT_1699718 [Phycomyces blakesleeanus]|uniref:F-box domain-containing protein n=2 Tax=Phycomyces blakesleeanus TaxID=4837 RepID=A0A163ABW8_PHYB8|nr:hypothetical protein PHYBLDRAFT_146631 [Phycomyces blakesleeanus NRRL 1555(-)]OAD72441.1 hypothetical protein PHYBLDRAFT_146631 [Phycomyces blakesleeanus NRRL 1555(-)]|eukprot:XP_018290481.1 hypothetical protein PHYBLDRAFT_146631 [Phycomyces blakesleeanus NRRL 1555(-)]
MLVSELPFELLLQISSQLLPKDKLNCVLVCKGWEVPFQDSLWKDMEVRSSESLKRVCKVAKRSASGLSYGLAVQNLRLNGEYSLYDVFKNNLFKIFLNLRHLDIAALGLNDKTLRMLNEHGLWKSLVSLKVTLDASSSEELAQFLLRLLRNTPSLEELDISPYSESRHLSLTLDDFRILHTHLPHLKSIASKLSFKTISQDEVVSVPSTTPAPLVKSLELNSVDWENLWSYHTWMYYFSYKYPNLQYLTWKIGHEISTPLAQDYQEMNEEFLQLTPKVFSHLETVDFSAMYTSALSHAVFWDIVCLSRAPIKNIKYKIVNRIWEPMGLVEKIRQSAQSCKETLGTLFFDGHIDFEVRQVASLELPYCPRLVELEMNNCSVSIILDNLLNSCPMLRKLSISGGELGVSTDANAQISRHGLRLLKINEMVISITAFNYVSLRCRQLEYLYLTQSQVSGPFYSLARYTDSRTAINLVLLSHLIGPWQRSLSIQDINKRFIVYPIGWFRLFYGLDDMFDCTKTSRRLSEQEADFVENYYRGFFINRLIPEGEDSLVYSVLQYFEDDWAKDLYKGHIELRFDYVAEYFVPLY